MMSKCGKNCALVAHLVVHRVVTWEVIRLLPGPTLRVFKITEEKVLPL